MMSVLSFMKSVQFNNLLKFCGLLEKKEIDLKIATMKKYVELNCLEQYEKVIILNNGVKSPDGSIKLDVEIYLFIEDRLEPFSGFEFVETILLSDCINSTFVGDSSGVDSAISELTTYMISNGFTPKGELYQVIEKLGNGNVRYDLYLEVSTGE